MELLIPLKLLKLLVLLNYWYYSNLLKTSCDLICIPSWNYRSYRNIQIIQLLKQFQYVGNYWAIEIISINWNRLKYWILSQSLKVLNWMTEIMWTILINLMFENTEAFASQFWSYWNVFNGFNNLKLIVLLQHFSNFKLLEIVQIIQTFFNHSTIQ